MSIQTDISWNMRVAAGVNELKRAVHEAAVDHGWWSKEVETVSNGITRVPVERNMGEMIALMHSELSEALEASRDTATADPTAIYYEYEFNGIPEISLEPTQLLPGHPATLIGKPVGIASEFADVIIRVLDTCEALEIPITRALVEKHNYNLTRPYRHGGKLA